MANEHDDLRPLRQAVDLLAAAFAATPIETFDLPTLTNASLIVNRAANMIDGFRADIAHVSNDRQPPPPPPPPNGGHSPGPDDNNTSGPNEPGPGDGRAPSGEPLDPNGHRGRHDSTRDRERARLFDELGALGDAIRRGDLSGGYADVINTATAQLGREERHDFLDSHATALCHAALAMTLHQFNVHVRGLVDDFCRANELERFNNLRRKRCGKTWNDPIDGMTKLFAAFDPETGARVRHAINQEIDRLYRAKRDDPTDNRTHQQLVADAIANLILGARAKGTSSTDLVVLVDLQTLLHTGTTTTTAGAAAAGAATSTDDTEAADGDTATPEPVNPGRCCETSDGTPLPVETVRHLACNANILPAVLNSNGVVLDLGRSQRLASPAQRAALRVMYPTCAFNDCDVPYDRCEIHHTDPFGPPTNGPTNLDKLVPTCNRDHHKIHDQHLQLAIDPATRTMTVTHPDGHQISHPLPKRRRPPQHRAAS